MKEFIDKLMERLNEELRPDKECFEYEDDYIYAEERHNKMLNIVNELAEEYKVSEMPTGWIPCSERLPEYTDEYNVTVDVASEFGCYRTVKTLRFERIEGKEPKWVIPQDEVYRVIAWMPLPEPFKEGE